mmetsp:Transcript_20171/g.29999  ORF Transcript_20171/g.29999 Transcript_20171/m.29999 type:complete len:101 (+) Transcript_20171:70-372(+)
MQTQRQIQREKPNSYHQQQTQIFSLENEIQQRSAEIEQIRQDQLDIQELFMDLRDLVKLQGEDVRSIEASIEKAVQSTDDGVQELQKAQRSQQSSSCVIC